VNPRVLRRFILLMAGLTVAMFVLWDVLDDFVTRPPGDFHTEMGSNRLVDGKYGEAMDHFDRALKEAPNHRGAFMGRALVFIQTKRYGQAIEELSQLIDHLGETLAPDDPTGTGVLAAAYANRGIVYDRLGRYEKALADYIAAIRTDADAVSGPGIVHKILYGADNVSSVRDRAKYLVEQLKLPEEKRVMRIPEIDAEQRMHKP
jgi:tetratricopeptide (TPR) repeat protein